VYFGDGSGGFTPGNSGLPGNRLTGISPGDVDNDGGCDVAFTNSSGGVEVWVFDDSTQSWQSRSGSLPGSGDYEATQLCDMNADGLVDLCALGAGQTRVWLGDGAGNWAEAAVVETPAPGYYVALRTGADFDHNGRPDIALVAEEGSWPNEQNVAHAFRETSAVREPGVFPVFPRGHEKFVDGSTQFIDWWSAAPAAESTRVKLELSTSGRTGPWQPIADTLPNAGRYQWFIPEGIVSGDCYIRYTVHGPGWSAEATTPRAFVIGDTVLGVSGPRPGWTRPAMLAGPTVVRGVLVLPASGPSAPLRAGSERTACGVLLDAAGRKVADLRTGANDVSGVPPGVYFVTTNVTGVRHKVIIE
jgi:hypothetical protein